MFHIIVWRPRALVVRRLSKSMDLIDLIWFDRIGVAYELIRHCSGWERIKIKVTEFKIRAQGNMSIVAASLWISSWNCRCVLDFSFVYRNDKLTKHQNHWPLRVSRAVPCSGQAGYFGLCRAPYNIWPRVQQCQSCKPAVLVQLFVLCKVV